MHKTIALRSTAIALALTAAFAGTAMGQAQTSQSQNSLEEITVTAQRRETNLQTTPVAVTAYSADQLEHQNINTAADLFRNVPNLVSKNNVTLGAANTYFMRGIGNTESISTFDVPVGTYIDEIYVARQNQNNVYLIDTQQVEVLRGPQGTLFGRNTTGGAISITSVKPSDNEEVKGDIGYGSYNQITGKLSVNMPLSDKVDDRFSAFGTHDDGWQHSVTTGAKLSFDHGWGVRDAVRLKASDNVEWNISADYSRDNHQQLGSAVNDALATKFLSGNQAYDTGSVSAVRTYLRPCENGATPLDWAHNNCTANDIESYNIYSNLQINLDYFNINLISGYRNMLQRTDADVIDNNVALTFGLNAWKLFSTQRSQEFSNELKITGKAWDDKINYVTGVYMMRETNTTDYGNDWDGPGFKDLLFSETNFDNSTTSLAWYAQADTEVAQNLFLTTGVRFTDERKYLEVNDFVSALGLPSFNTATLLADHIPDHLQTDRWTPKVSLQYRFTPDVNAYVSATNGFKSGGWNARATAANEFTNFGPEKAWSYEGGIRSQWLDNRLRINATGYYVKYDDIQIATVYPGTSDFETSNAGDSIDYGAEIETSAIIAKGFQVYANLGLQHGKFTRLNEPAALQSAIFLNTIPVQEPKYTLQVGASYATPMRALNGTITFSGDVRATGGYQMDNSNAANAYVVGYYTINGAIEYENDNGHWAASIDCSNCADRRYWTTILFDVRYPDQPLRIMAHIKFKY